MKQLLSLILFALICQNTFAQDFEVTDKYTRISCAAETEGYSDIYIIFKGNTGNKVVKTIKKYAKKVHKYSAKATKKNKRNFKKPIPGYINYDEIHFSFRGVNHASSDSFIVPVFQSDENGKHFLLLRGYYEGYDQEKTIITKKGKGKTIFEQSKFNFNIKVQDENLDRWLQDIDAALK